MERERSTVEIVIKMGEWKEGVERMKKTCAINIIKSSEQVSVFASSLAGDR